jgi:hypothetical protein
VHLKLGDWFGKKRGEGRCQRIFFRRITIFLHTVVYKETQQKSIMMYDVDYIQYSQFCNCRYMGWYWVSYNAVPKKITKKTVISTYPVPVEIYGIPYTKKVTEFLEIPKFSGIPRNFCQFRTEYRIDGSKKKKGILC